MAWDGEHWNANKTLSYNCLWNFVVGMRGGGKTYGALCKCVENFIKAKKDGRVEQFIYLRRYKTEIEKLTISRGGRLFNAIIKNKEFPGYQFKAESNVLQIKCPGEEQWETLGYGMSLTTSLVQKSDSFPDVTTIVFDEFIINPHDNYRYLKGEVTKFKEFYETVARERKGTKDSKDVVVLFLSNAVSVSNPYFDHWNLNKPRDGQFQRFGKEILVENFVSPELAKRKKESRFGSIVAGSDYAEYAYDNAWLLDNTDFLGKKTQRSRYFATLIFMGKSMGVWVDELQWLYYISDDVDNDCERVYSVTTDDHKPNMLLFKSARKLPVIKALMDAYNYGAVRYEDIKLKNSFREIMRMCNYV